MGASFQEMTPHILLHGSSWHTNLEKYLKLCSLPNGKISICRQKNECDLKNKISFGGVENIVGKEEHAGYHFFFLFPQCVSMMLMKDILPFFFDETASKCFKE